VRWRDDERVEPIFGGLGTVLPYPFSLLELYDLVREVEAEFEAAEGDDT
jgi:hypothetical protein